MSVDEIDFHRACSVQFFGTELPPELNYSLNDMKRLAEDTIQRSISVPGVQPKLSMDFSHGSSRLTVVGALGGNYIFKPPNKDYSEMPENEHVTMRIAEAFGIQVVPSSLIRLKSGELSYITKRIDRTKDGNKIHMLDLFQITEAFDKYRSSVERIGKALHSHAANTQLDKLFFFELVIFCYLTGNNDMHLKNFSMIENQGVWKLAPAYDLLNVSIVNPEDKEEMALTLKGKKSGFRKKHFIELGESLLLTEKQILGVFKRFNKKQASAKNWLENSFLSEELIEAYNSILDKRFSSVKH
ncbi:HipA domain-containing protein [Flavicella sp.]|uniref:HipA domain-containing protein n=1 Tax=Flavicella sp. TaxID=2957742 RepID=UPI0034424E42